LRLASSTRIERNCRPIGRLKPALSPIQITERLGFFGLASVAVEGSRQVSGKSILGGIQEINLLALIKSFHETYNPCGFYILRMEKSL
jgi:hypothetical protein